MIIGTAGHIDHGKTALVRALTGVDADRLAEEKQRGMTIDLGFAYLPIDENEILGFVDVPGHEKFLHNMLAGATSVHFALLVVAADDGVMPQTREHAAILDLLGLGAGAVALTKIDLVDAPRRDAVRAEIRALLHGGALEKAPIFPLSSMTGEGVAPLLDHIRAAAKAHRAQSTQGLFTLAIDRAFTRSGAGTIVTGAALSGVVDIGDALLVSPTGLAARVRSIHGQNRAATQGHAGERCALNLVGDKIAKDALRRGDMLIAPELFAPTARVDVSLRVLADLERPLESWTPARLHIGAAEVGARLVPLSRERFAAGETGFAQLALDAEIAAFCGDRFILRDPAAQRLLGGGEIVDPHPPARKRRTPERLQQLAAQAIKDARAALDALLDCAPGFADLDAFARDRRLSAATLLADAPNFLALANDGGRIALSRRRAGEIEAETLATLAAHHENRPDEPGLGVSRLHRALEPRLPYPAFRSLLAAFAQKGAIVTRGAWARLPQHEAHLSPADEQLWSTIAPMLGGPSRFRPPRTRDIAKALQLDERDVRRLLKTQSRRSALDEIAHDHFFLRGVTAEMVDIARALTEASAARDFSAAQFRDVTQNGRKVAIEILEFFDRHGVTLRRGDLRRINPRRLDLFREDAEEEAP